ncbi:MAG: UDP-N-acetylmuramate--L-alanine ligase [Patescibacteria group bacterium]|nr:UDP-N-acetylmuramate--L-alanine ligase [Patescibacteria group bacterium]
MNLNSAKNIFCIGIGGIGLSALARLLHWRGKKVIGSDLVRGAVTESLKQLGIQIHIGQPKPTHISRETEVVIHSLAIPNDHPELLEAKKRKLTLLSYPAALGELTRRKKLITVSGTHGKTTTTALLGQVLVKADWDPTIIVGSLVPKFDGNARLGKSDTYVLEADEYGRAFLNYRPRVAIITNIEPDHLDVYRDLRDIQETFTQFLKNVDRKGFIVANADDQTVQSALKTIKVPVITYGINQGEYRAEKIRYGRRAVFIEKHLGQVELGLAGRHNVLNALAVIACAHKLGIPPEIIKKSLTHFTGVWRRFELVGKFQGALVISDYAHHPTELKATLESAREAHPGRRIIAVFQPHQRSRTKKLFHEFAHAFASADKVILTEIYDVAGRETGSTHISSFQLAEAIKKSGQDVQFAKDFHAAKHLIKKMVSPRDLILVMGAGTIDNLARELVIKK